ncbi:hypothetical protein HN643_01155 [Candidatus Falkowbacteria bacterium]|nr:hypothetical protein [Candidatus Falkowbacteria bacterium]MBT5503773.1 hypothetical protein [Candidatus Falkowbacteria bacterium]MBT6573938.1 hypothetical protein [Candidatus Falkowbacteria bacterium]MBT7500267.1 hypothetical protein [Candidatus Falkowbacteria bacterium]
MNKNCNNCLNMRGTDFTSGADFGISPTSVQSDLTSSPIEIVVFTYI